MNILADIIMFKPTTGDIVIEGLTYFLTLYAKDFKPLPMVLTVDPIQLLLKEFLIPVPSHMVLKDTITQNIHTRFSIIPEQMPPNHMVLQEDPCPVTLILPPLKLEPSHLVLQSNVVKVTPYSIFTPASPERMVLTESELPIPKIIYLYPQQAPLHNLDFLYLWEMDPYRLDELDYYGVGTRLFTSCVVSTISKGWEFNESHAVMDTTLDLTRMKPLDITSISMMKIGCEPCDVITRSVAYVYEVDGRNDELIFGNLDKYTLDGIGYEAFMEIYE